MIKNIFLYFFYAIISSLGLYKIKLSGLSLSNDLILGGLLYGIGFLVWLYILKTNSLSVAFPIAASALIVATQITGIFLLAESYNFYKLLGVGIVIVGIIIIFAFSK